MARPAQLQTQRPAASDTRRTPPVRGDEGASAGIRGAAASLAKAALRGGEVVVGAHARVARRRLDGLRDLLATGGHF